MTDISIYNQLWLPCILSEFESLKSKGWEYSYPGIILDPKNVGNNNVETVCHTWSLTHRVLDDDNDIIIMFSSKWFLPNNIIYNKIRRKVRFWVSPLMFPFSENARCRRLGKDLVQYRRGQLTERFANRSGEQSLHVFLFVHTHTHTHLPERSVTPFSRNMACRKPLFRERCIFRV